MILFKINKQDALLTTEFRYDPMEDELRFYQLARKGREAYYKSEIGSKLKDDMRNYVKEADISHK